MSLQSSQVPGGNGAPPTVPVFGSPTDDRREPVRIAMSICFAAAAIAVLLRVVTKTSFTKAKLWWDDWLVLFALIWSLGFFICTILLMNYGLGRHVDLTNSAAITNFLKTYLPAACFYATSISFSKLSILVFYWRIFRPIKQIHLPIYILGSIVVAWNIAIVLVVIFQCTPVNFWWNRSIIGGKCVDNTKFLLGNSVPNIATDIAILLLPIPFIWNLQQSSGRKLALIGIFMLGGFVCVVSIIRLAIQLQTDFTSPDLSWTITSFVMWTNVETNLAVVSSCLPSLRPVLSVLGVRAKNTFSRQSGYKNTAYGKSSQGVESRKFGKPKGYSPHHGSDTDTHIVSAEVDEYPLVHSRSEGANSKMGGIQVDREFRVTEDRR
ncbi:integral membrane protein [Glarea lozoyensis ATCC 20868]|uniref:Integral membrane protein n=1 Tax=Glarea lozoyensis (strain ATCC 20868 / MF5171) TaxID=1116229 RepID=S3CZQ4_GLAL2|nr:uncharacterized protein GLAREA_12493 [Glarea lozoyensis ATCC 20868]EPE31737.1 integral membrane protein [Glarea lozoyensis ATCC 20868]